MSHLFFHLPLHHMSRFKNTELGELYVSSSIKTFAESLVGIFVPIYLLSLGFNLSSVLFYFVIWFFAKLFMEVPVGKLIAAIGPKHVMSLSYLLRIVYLTALATFPTLGWSIYFTAPLGGVVVSLFFTSYHIAFASIHGKHGGREIAGINILLALASALGPFVGGLLAQVYGLRPVLAAAAVLMIVSIRPLFKTGEIVAKEIDFSLQRVPKKALLRIMPFTLMESIEGLAMLLIWPLYLSVVFFGDKSFQDIGLLTSLSLVIIVGLEVLAGKILDHGHSKQLLVGSSVVLVAGNVLRLLVRQPIGFLVADLTARSANIGAKDSYFYRLYGHSKEGYRTEFITLNETIMNLFKLSFLSVLYVLSLTASLHTVFYTAFVAAGIVALIVGMLASRKGVA